MNSIKYYLPAFLVASIIFYLSSLPGSAIPTLGIRFEDLFLHFIAYSVFGFTLGLAVSQGRPSLTSREIGFAILIGILYGLSDEWHQSFTPGRFMSLSDAIADAFGSAAGVFIFNRFPKLRFWEVRC